MNENRQLRDDAIVIWKSGVAAVNATTLVRDFVSVSKGELVIGERHFILAAIERIIVVGFGKASGAMAAGLEQALGESLLKSKSVAGLVNVPDDQLVETAVIQVAGCRPPGVNLPTPRVLDATREILELVRSAGPNDICICLISGGGSALLEHPTHPITLEEFRSTTTRLSNSGASIYELNAVRRAISDVKGGGLATASGGAPMISLIVSDVVGDNLDVIASGPTVVTTSEITPLSVLKKFDSNQDRFPESVWSVVQSFGDAPAALPNKNNANLVIGNVETAMQAAKSTAESLGYQVAVKSASGNEGDAAVVGQSVARQVEMMIQSGGRRCQIAGGETTVDGVGTSGRGGRNQHLVLAAIVSRLKKPAHLSGEFCFLSAGTDGEDGNVPVAGAWADTDLLKEWISAQTSGHLANGILSRLESALGRFDSYSVLSDMQCLLKVPQTFTNVCDLRIVLTRAINHE